MLRGFRGEIARVCEVEVLELIRNGVDYFRNTMSDVDDKVAALRIQIFRPVAS